ncbi:hypothetical protein K443DRAFT_101285, partial [Laccaria amethystina LaAM-08-1]
IRRTSTRPNSPQERQSHLCTMLKPSQPSSSGSPDRWCVTPAPLTGGPRQHPNTWIDYTPRKGMWLLFFFSRQIYSLLGQSPMSDLTSL